MIFPFPAQGHMLPILDLAHQLTLHALTKITILITPKNLPILNPLLSTHPSIQTLVLPFPTNQPSIPSGVENVKDLPFSGFGTMMFALSKLYDPLLQWFNINPSPPTAIVYDFFFLGWTQHLCRHVGIRGYAFSPCGALSLSIFSSIWCDRPALVDEDGNKNQVITFSKVPKSPSFPWWQISVPYRQFCENEEDPLLKFLGRNFGENSSCDGLILNTFSDMEECYLTHLKEVLGHDRVWAVGPLLPPGDDMAVGQRGGSSVVSDDAVCKWLDKRECGSVVYVCFGSQIVFSNEQMLALTKALEKSGVNFIFVYKGTSKGHSEDEKYGSIPPGFEERVAGRGLLINGWAPQIAILKHPAIGAFLMHGGWNAILENILLAGIPMLVWPMINDHYANAIVIVDELKIGVRVCAGIQTVPDSDELPSLLDKAISELDEERKRGIKLHRAALAAIREGGNSFQGLNNLAAHLSQHAQINKNNNLHH